MKKKIKILLMFFLFCTAVVQAQERVVSGKVTDKQDNVLPGVSIIVKGTYVGTVSDMNGKFSFSVPADATTLEFSIVGYKKMEENISGRSEINVIMEQELYDLDEVVTIAYGTKKKRSVIGSISKIDSKELTQAPVLSFEQALSGLATGVQVSSQGGVPGAPVQIKIRGISSISSATDPLWIIDGVPVSSGNMGASPGGEIRQSSMSMINPEDIESIEVLKDAAATAIYGSRASNGVILITTKSGKKGRGTFSLDIKGGISNWSKKDIGLANSREFFEIMDQAKYNTLGPGNEYNPQEDIISPLLAGWTTPITREQAMATNTDWFDAISRTGSYYEMNLAASSGTEKTNSYVSLNYRSDESSLKYNSLKRLSGRFNFEYNPVKNFKLGMRTMISYSTNDRVKSIGGKNNAGGGISQTMNLSMPWMPIYESSDPSGYWNPKTGANALAGMDPRFCKSNLTTFRSIGNAYGEWNMSFVKGLVLRGEIGYDFIELKDLSWVSKVLRDEGNHEAGESKNNRLSYTYNIRFHYNRTFNKHNISAVFGMESQKDISHNIVVEGKDLIGDFQQVGTPLTVLKASAYLYGENYFRGYFGRIDYAFADKYFFGASLRYDGSSKFSPENRWGTFAALSAGWILSEESFINVDWISLLKLRGSFGQTGNQHIPTNVNVTNYVIRNGRGTYMFEPSSMIKNIGNSSVKWETTNNSDIGVDFGLFKNRLSGSVAYFNQNINDLLLSVPLPPSAGIAGGNRIWQNIGDMINRGFEINLDAFVINNSSFTWKLSVNYTNNHNKVINLSPDVDNSGTGIITRYTITKKGLPIGAYYMAESAGVDPQKGIPLIYEVDQEVLGNTGETVLTGNKIPATQANLAANKFIHKEKTGVPIYYGGINNYFEYKNFDLLINFTYSGGNYIYNESREKQTMPNYGIHNVYRDILYGAWQKPGDNAEWPQLTWNKLFDYDSNGDPVNSPAKYLDQRESRFLEKANYFRLNNVVLGYTFHFEKLKSIRVYFSGMNLFTSTPFSGWDPEFPLSGNINGMIYTNNAIPKIRTFSLGASFKF